MKNHTLSFGYAETECGSGDSYDSGSDSTDSDHRRRRKRRVEIMEAKRKELKREIRRLKQLRDLQVLEAELEAIRGVSSTARQSTQGRPAKGSRTAHPCPNGWATQVFYSKGGISSAEDRRETCHGDDILQKEGLSINNRCKSR